MELNNNIIIRPLSTIGEEIRFYMNQAAESLLEVGTKLSEAKEQLQHGEWLPWLKENVGIPDRTASHYMKLAEEFGDSQIGRRIPISKLQILLNIPKEKREKFIEDNNVEDSKVSVRKLKGMVDMTNGIYIQGEGRTISEDTKEDSQEDNIEIEDDVKESEPEETIDSTIEDDIEKVEEEINVVEVNDPVVEVIIPNVKETIEPEIITSPLDKIKAVIKAMHNELDNVEPLLNEDSFESQEQRDEIYNLFEELRRRVMDDKNIVKNCDWIGKPVSNAGRKVGYRKIKEDNISNNNDTNTQEVTT